MKSFNDYAEKAINRYNLNGYNNLAKELNVDKSAVSFFRSGKSLPSESTMIKLAELAGLPKEEALIDLNLWRAKKNPELSKVWSRIAKMIVKSTAVLVLFYTIFTSPHCFANEISDTVTSITAENIYIMRQNFRKQKGVCALF